MKPNQKMVDRHGVEVALLPMEHWRVTQDVGGSRSHLGAYAIDVGGKIWGGKGREAVYAPFKCKVVYKTTKYNAVVFQSVEPVKQPFGVSHVFMGLLHDDDISDLCVGKVFEQGDLIYQEGTAGSRGQTGVYASHLHLSVARGTYLSGNPFFKNSTGGYDMKFAVDPRTVFFANDTIMLNPGIAPWKLFVELNKPVVGDTVFIKPTATKWATGQVISPAVKKNGKRPGPYKIVADGDNPPKGKRYPKGAWLLAKVNSWVRKVDVE